MNQKTLNAMETAVFENAVREEKERIARASRNYTRRHLGEIDKARALEIQKAEKEAKEIKADDYFEDMDMVTEGLAQRERIEAIIQWAHSQEIKTSLFEVSALRFHQQQHGLATKEEYSSSQLTDLQTRLDELQNLQG